LHLRVSVPRQEMDLLHGDTVLETFRISTSKFGLGTEPGSFRTPTGRFRIAEKHGAGAPLWAVFKSRIFTGEIARPGGDEDLVLTRILWLDGLEPDNANTYSRYIYLHGTNQETLLGQPASHGCIRLANLAIVDLFNRVPTDTPVEILA
jgi:lipoprotein-anchoring transpeptidase ErfK/SrfK